MRKVSLYIVREIERTVCVNAIEDNTQLERLELTIGWLSFVATFIQYAGTGASAGTLYQKSIL